MGQELCYFLVSLALRESLEYGMNRLSIFE